jgi:hypothetical protein
VINITLPDEKTNYVHRIGRVGRAERMGLAVSLVSTVPEKVWYHGEWCPSRGRSCWNTDLTSRGGCCIWYNEKQVNCKHFEGIRVIETFNFENATNCIMTIMEIASNLRLMMYVYVSYLGAEGKGGMYSFWFWLLIECLLRPGLLFLVFEHLLSFFG